jgi:hypothetical protein
MPKLDLTPWSPNSVLINSRGEALHRLQAPFHPIFREAVHITWGAITRAAAISYWEMQKRGTHG